MQLKLCGITNLTIFSQVCCQCLTHTDKLNKLECKIDSFSEQIFSLFDAFRKEFTRISASQEGQLKEMIERLAQLKERNPDTDFEASNINECHLQECHLQDPHSQDDAPVDGSSTSCNNDKLVPHEIDRSLIGNHSSPVDMLAQSFLTVRQTEIDPHQQQIFATDQTKDLGGEDIQRSSSALHSNSFCTVESFSPKHKRTSRKRQQKLQGHSMNNLKKPLTTSNKENMHTLHSRTLKSFPSEGTNSMKVTKELPKHLHSEDDGFLTSPPLVELPMTSNVY